jgi:16S rRNA (adenine1518-N6/adenine1519-N6)-dimethyltransferase
MTALKKSLGQNFLMHPRIAERIVAVAKLSPNGTVLEIGPGTGMLTRALLAEVKKVIAVEADGTLVEKLQETFAPEIEEGGLVVVHEDIRNFSIEKFLMEPYSVVANIPYYITGEILRMFLGAKHKPSSMTMLVQKEVAHRIAREKTESILSLSVKVYGTPAYCFTVPRGAFFPAPNVDSAVLTIQSIRNDAFKNSRDEESFFTLIKTGFAHKRKRLAKNLEELADAKQIASAFALAKVDSNARSETLSLSQWQTLHTHLL